MTEPSSHLLKFVKRIDFKLSVLATNKNAWTKKPKNKKNEKTLIGVGYVCCLDCGDDIEGVCIYPNSLNCTHEICAVFCVSIIPK